ncbi:hypothetical protein Vretimale_14584 [Volvox reticuliferus]|uniref:30S ribosomal protein S16, chloroplastic n=1 Tax=Volvox reticuliferus TaxID=1737510 RepID=A0A8J4GP24_9CHLO|nr:hypothetical protein Vretifemale_13250 [Volvox reticuliferus]GIM10999.1 hypothetical protein Vretimale_14584 [Volvox reticuliferus]
MQALSSKAFTGSVKPFTATRVSTSRPARVATVIENRVALRFQRFGRKKLPFYRLVAIDSKKRRDGEPLEYLGWYDPLKKETNLNAPAIKEWLAKGALPSETVENLLRKAYVMEPKAVVVVPKDAVKL